MDAVEKYIVENVVYICGLRVFVRSGCHGGSYWQ